MLKQHNEMDGNDDWLAEEIRRENRISAWDMDGGKLVREEHEAGCDARRLAAEHALDCDAEAEAQAHRKVHGDNEPGQGFGEAVRAITRQNDGNVQLEKKTLIVCALFGAFALMACFPYLIPLLPLLIIGLAARAAGNKRNQR